MIKNSALSIMQSAINHYLSLDPQSAKRLHRLQGKVMHVELKPFGFLFQIEINNERVLLTTDNLQTPETIIRGTPLQMLGVAVSPSQRQRFFAEDVIIEGNAELGQQITHVFDNMDIDWEEYLSKLIGDVPAHHTGRFIRGATSWLRNAKEAFAQDMSDYLHEETLFLPNKELLQNFFNDIDILRMDIDRIEAKMNRLKESIKQDIKDTP